MVKEFEGKKLLVLGGVKLACDIVTHAQKMGAYVIVADYNMDSPAKEVADEGVLIDAMDIEAIVDYCKKNNVDGVTTGFVDILMTVVYEVTKRLGLPCYWTPKMLQMATNKVDFKDTCTKYDVPVPKTYLLGDTISEELLNKIEYPVFVKPLDASGSRGAGVCNNDQELKSQFEEALSYSSSNNAIIEDYITGTEFLLDYVGIDGEWRLLSMFDRYMSDDRGSAINYSNISMAPAKKINNYLATVNEKIIQMFKELNFKDGLIFLQGHTNGNKITFYEMGARLGGSFYNLEQAYLGYNPVDMIVRCALTGKMANDISMIPKDVANFSKTAVVCNYLLKGSDETIHSIEGLEEMKKIPSYVSSILQRGVGYHYTADRTVDKPVICVYLLADSLTQAKEDICKLNTIFDVKNSSGTSLLMKKLDPSIL